jgi:MtN3 and saliva related transmembrane protein
MIGSIAGILTTLSFVPQVIKALQTKDTKAISLGMYLMSVIGIFLWMVHGYVMGDMALLVANLITFCLALVILIAKLKYK